MAYHSCKNCNQPFGTSYKFCPNCGQIQADTLTLKELFNNTIQNYLAFDARFFKSFIPLIIKPGFLPSEFVKGKRLTYLHPAQLYLFSTILFFFLFSFQVKKSADSLNTSLSEMFTKEKDSLSAEALQKQHIEDSISEIKIKETLHKSNGILKLSKDEIDSIAKNNGNKKPINLDIDFSEQKVDSLIAINSSDEVIYREMGMDADAGFLTRQYYKQSLKFYKNHEAGSIYKQFMDSIPITLFFLLPIFAILLRLFYYKRKIYVNHLVFSFYYFAFIFFVFSGIMIINYIYDIPDYLDVLAILSCFVYLVVAIKKYYNKNWLGTFFKTSLLTLTYFILVIPVATIITLIISFLFF